MKSLKQFSNVEAFSKSDLNFLVKQKLNGQYVLLNNDEKILESIVNFSYIEILEKEIIFIDDFYGKKIIFDFRGKIATTPYDFSIEADYFFQSKLGISLIKKGEIYSSDFNLNKEASCELFQNFKSKWKVEYFGRLNFYPNSLILKYPNPIDGNNFTSQFTRLSFETGEKLWDFDLEQHRHKIISAYPYTDMFEQENATTDVKEPIGVYQDQLWFSMSHYGLLCLNYLTGEFMHYLRDCPQNDLRYGGLPYGNFPVIPYTENAVIVEDEGKMVCFDGMYYWELNLETLVLDFHYLADYFQEVKCSTFGARIKKLIVEGEKLYMVATNHKKFACFNRNTLKYDWIETLPEGTGAPRSIEKHGNRLYIDTSAKQLLVYELEGNE